jgi:hypothetical protein
MVTAVAVYRRKNKGRATSLKWRRYTVRFLCRRVPFENLLSGVKNLLR